MSYTGMVLSFHLIWLRALYNRLFLLVAFKVSDTQGGKFSKLLDLQKSASNCIWSSENKLAAGAASSTFNTFFSSYLAPPILQWVNSLHLAQELDLYSICIHKTLAQYTRFFMHNLLSRIVIVNILLYSESTGSYYLVYSHRWSEYSTICFFRYNHKR